jgi:hypothetical protein
MKKNILLSTLAATLLLTTTINAQTDSKVLIDNQIKKHTQEQKQLPKDIVLAIQDTFKALHAIEKNNIDTAKNLLKDADSKFTAVLKKDPTLDLIPLEEKVVRFSFLGDSKEIKKALKLTKELIDNYDIKVAQGVLNSLKDEVDINIVSIPMKLYPTVTKTALKALEKGDKKGALMALADGFSMLVNTQIIIPTPLLVAQDLVVEASQMDKSKKDEVQKLLTLAKEELNRAKLLGYTKLHTKAYQVINDDIEKLEKEIKGKNIVEKLYEKIINDFKKLVGDTRNDEQKVSKLEDSVAKKEAQALKNPSAIDGDPKAKTEVKEATKMLKEEAKDKAKDFEQEAKKDMSDTVSK